MLPCPGMAGEQFASEVQGMRKMQDAISSVAVSTVSYRVATRSYSFPAITHPVVSPIIAAVDVKSPLVTGVEVTASAVGIKLCNSPASWTYLCPLG